MCDSSSSSSERSTSSNSSTHSEETVTRGDLKNPSRPRSPTSKDTASLPDKWIGEGPADTYASGERYRDGEPAHSKSNSGAVRRRPQVRYKTHAQMIKEKLEQIKAEMLKLSEQHRCQCPTRKAHHPFVWNSLSPYRDTTEIDYLLAMSYKHHGSEGAPLMKHLLP